MKQRKDLNIYVIAERNGWQLADRTDAYGFHLIRIDSPMNRIAARCIRKAQASGRGAALYQKLSRLITQADRVFRYAETICRTYTRSEALKRAYLRAMQSISDPVDLMVATCFPIEGLLAASDYCGQHPETRLVPYFFDPYADNQTMHRTPANARRKFDRHVAIESELLRRADRILMLHHIRPHFEVYHHHDLKRCIFVEHPTLFLRAGNSAQKPAESESDDGCAPDGTGRPLSLIYTGSVNQTIRPPAAVLSCLIELAQVLPITADFYVAGNAAGDVRAAAKAHPDVIRCSGFIAKDMADRAVDEADVLINIGNTNLNQSPSKIFEYLGTGKPILHFAFVDGDEVERLLIDYPLAQTVHLNSGGEAETVSAVKSFLSENARRRVDADTLRALYPDALPETTAEIIAGLLD